MNTVAAPMPIRRSLIPKELFSGGMATARFYEFIERTYKYLICESFYKPLDFCVIDTLNILIS